jgi:hypothetical protein
MSFFLLYLHIIISSHKICTRCSSAEHVLYSYIYLYGSSGLIEETIVPVLLARETNKKPKWSTKCETIIST